MKVIININDNIVKIMKRICTKKTVIFGIAALFFAGGLFMFSETLTKPFTFSAGDVVSSSKINDNFDALYNRRLESLSDVETNGLANGKILKWDGSQWYMADDETGDGSGSPAYGANASAPEDSVYVDGDGNVGIGTTDPHGNRLSVLGNFYTDGEAEITGNVYLCTDTGYDGNVGIGTTSPQEKIEIQDGHLSLYHTTDQIGAGYAINWFSDGGASHTELGRIGFNQTANGADGAYFKINTHNGTSIDERFRIDKDGNVGIGTTIPNYKLDVDGDINCSGDFYNSGTPVADYVFGEDYTVLSIEEHAQTMWENKHLPMVAGKDDLGDKPYSMSERREQILEELEIAHIYIEQLNDTIKKLESRIEEFENK